MTVCAVMLTFHLGASSSIERAKEHKQKDYEYIVTMNVPVQNFGTDKQKNSYKIIKQDYQRALTFYFEEDYLKSYKMFVKVRTGLETLYSQMSIVYINRTREILDDISNKWFDIHIEYGRDTQMVGYMLKDITPSSEAVFYDPKMFHFVYDKYIMERNVKQASQLLGKAKKLRKMAISIAKYFKPADPLTPETPRIDMLRLEMLRKYQGVISLCRYSKQNALSAYKAFNRNLIYDTKKFKDNPYFLPKNIDSDPIFDTRIPGVYLVDANDILNRIHEIELKLKLLLESRKKKVNRANTAKQPTR